MQYAVPMSQQRQCETKANIKERCENSFSLAQDMSTGPIVARWFTGVANYVQSI